MMYHSPLNKVKEELKERGMRQAHLAKKLNISPQQLNAIFRKNQESSIYLPKMAEILGIDESALKYGTSNPTRLIQILDDSDFQSLADNTVLFEELSNVIFDSLPFSTEKNHYLFGYRLKQTISKDLLGDDLIILDSFLPLYSQLSGRIGIVFIASIGAVFIGTLRYNDTDRLISVYNDNNMFNLKQGDLLLGVAEILQRKLHN